jgi:hypothetical protein
MMELYLHFPIYLHGVVRNYLSTGATLPLPYMHLKLLKLELRRCSPPLSKGTVLCTVFRRPSGSLKWTWSGGMWGLSGKWQTSSPDCVLCPETSWQDAVPQTTVRSHSQTWWWPCGTGLRTKQGRMQLAELCLRAQLGALDDWQKCEERRDRKEID